MAVNSFSGQPAIPASYGYAAGKNSILNSATQIWQRGTSFTIPNGVPTYFADRFQITRIATGCTATQQATSDTTNLPFIQYCARVARDSGDTSTSPIYLTYSMDSITTKPLAGKTITFSYYARAGANYSASGSSLSIILNTGTGTDQNINGGYTGSVTALSTSVTLTTTWQRFTHTMNIGATATELGFYYTFTPVGTAGANDYFEITGFQIEAGSTATSFQTATGTIQGELAACQRYYIRLNTANITGAQIGVGFAGTTQIGTFSVPLPVTLRSRSSNTLDYANLRLMDYNNGYTGISTVGVYQGATDNLIWINVNMSSAVLTQYRPLFIDTQANGYLGIGAEL